MPFMHFFRQDGADGQLPLAIHKFEAPGGRERQEAVFHSQPARDPIEVEEIAIFVGVTDLTGSSCKVYGADYLGRFRFSLRYGDRAYPLDYESLPDAMDIRLSQQNKVPDMHHDRSPVGYRQAFSLRLADCRAFLMIPGSRATLKMERDLTPDGVYQGEIETLFFAELREGLQVEPRHVRMRRLQAGG